MLTIDVVIRLQISSDLLKIRAWVQEMHLTGEPLIEA